MHLSLKLGDNYATKFLTANFSEVLCSMDLGMKCVLEGLILHQCYQSQVSSFCAISKIMKLQNAT